MTSPEYVSSTLLPPLALVPLKKLKIEAETFDIEGLLTKFFSNSLFFKVSYQSDMLTNVVYSFMVA